MWVRRGKGALERELEEVVADLEGCRETIVDVRGRNAELEGMVEGAEKKAAELAAEIIFVRKEWEGEIGVLHGNIAEVERREGERVAVLVGELEERKRENAELQERIVGLQSNGVDGASAADLRTTIGVLTTQLAEAKGEIERLQKKKVCIHCVICYSNVLVCP